MQFLALALGAGDAVDAGGKMMGVSAEAPPEDADLCVRASAFSAYLASRLRFCVSAFYASLASRLRFCDSHVMIALSAAHRTVTAARCSSIVRSSSWRGG